MYGKRIRELRKEKGLTAKELGELISAAESTVSGYENETRKPDIDVLKKLSQLFDAQVDYILGLSDKRNSESGFAFYGGGDDWTEEDWEAAQIAVETRRKMREKNKK